jgi:hypothetical protein
MQERPTRQIMAYMPYSVLPQRNDASLVMRAVVNYRRIRAHMSDGLTTDNSTLTGRADGERSQAEAAREESRTSERGNNSSADDLHDATLPGARRACEPSVTLLNVTADNYILGV